MINDNEKILFYLLQMNNTSVVFVNEAKNNPILIQKLVQYAVSNEKYSWRAMWLLAKYLKTESSTQINKYSDILIKGLKNNLKNGYLRETLKVLSKLELSEEQESELFEFCLQTFQNNKNQPSLRSACMDFLIIICYKYPELNKEINEVFYTYKNFLSDGIKNSLEQKLKKNKIVE